MFKKLQRWISQTRNSPAANRRGVGRAMMGLAFAMLFIFLINFSVIVATQRKYGENLKKKADQVHQVTTRDVARRGTIYDRNGAIIAVDSTTYSIYAIVDQDYSDHGKKLYVEPKQYEKVAEILRQQLDIDAKTVRQRLATKDVFQVYFGSKGNNIDHSKKSAILEAMEKAGIEGIGFEATPSRLYPNGVFASNFIGLAQTETAEDGSQSLVGKTGLESSMNDILSGKDGVSVYEKDYQGRIVPGAKVNSGQAVDGKNVYTTLSAELEILLESSMKQLTDKTKPKQASATIMSAKTGEILATTQYPTYDANTKEGLGGKDFVWGSQLYQTTYEPGSTMKSLFLASAIDQGVFRPYDHYTNDTLRIIDTDINDWSINDGKNAQTMTYAQGFAFSSNVGMTKIEQEMGNSVWQRYLENYRFGEATNFGMSEESSGSLPEQNLVSIPMSCFGQAISVTQLQMLRGFTAIANDGIMLEPQFVSAIYDENEGSIRKTKKEVVGNPVTANAAKQTREYMITVGTDPNYGTMYSSYMNAPIVSVDGYNIALKSGTAQIADKGVYLKGSQDYVHSLVAMIPAEDPQLIMYVTLQQGQSFVSSYWGNMFNAVLAAAMHQDKALNLSTPSSYLSGQEKKMFYTPGNMVGTNVDQAAQTLHRNLVHPIIIGNGATIKRMSFKSDSDLAAGDQVLLLTEEIKDAKTTDEKEAIKIPDMYGWTKKNVETYAKWVGLEVTFDGKGGTVTEQSVRSGEPLMDHKKIKMTLGD